MSISEGGKSAAMKTVRLLRTPMVFVSVFYIIWVSMFTVRGITAVHEDDYVNSLKALATCYFQNYNPTDPSLYQSKCGYHPKEVC